MADIAKHSPGPWKVGGSRTGPTTARVDGPTVAGRDWDCEHVTRGMDTIAIVPQQEYGGSFEANARLIAAAPELLEALYAADLLLQDHKMSLPQVKAAIAKAEGRS